jgi:glycosyltransferase involved in cell wall biosynthesis
MRVAVVNAAADPSLTSPVTLLDTYRSLTGWSEALLDAGATDVRVVQRFHDPADVERRGVVYAFRSHGGRRWRARAAWLHALRGEIAGFDPDVVHVNGTVFGPELATIRHVRPEALVVVQHHGEPLPRTRAGRLYLRRALREADLLLFSTTAHADAWVRAGVVASWARTADVMESSTDMTPVSRDEARRRSQLSGSPACLWVGRLTAVKDPMTVLLGFERALGDLQSAQLAFVHQRDDLLPMLLAYVERRPALRRAVQFRGAIAHDDLPAFYSASDLIVSGSHREGSGYAVIEAQACGTPAAVTDIPSFRVLTDDGRLGVLWRPGDPDACRGAILEVSRASGELRQQVRAHFLSRFTWRAIGCRAMKLYEEARIAKSPPASARWPREHGEAAP